MCGPWWGEEGPVPAACSLEGPEASSDPRDIGQKQSRTQKRLRARACSGVLPAMDTDFLGALPALAAWGRGWRGHCLPVSPWAARSRAHARESLRDTQSQEAT